jgi:hypothetical protein
VQGAGLFVTRGSINLANSTLFANAATGGPGGVIGGSGSIEKGGDAAGGGLDLGSSSTSLSGTTVASNPGVAATLGSTSVTLASTALFANAAKGGPGGSASTSRIRDSGKGGDAAGGGLYLGSGSISLAGTTVASNQAVTATEPAPKGKSSGGGIANAGAGLTINTTLIGNNTQDSGNANNGNDMSGPITSSYSLFGQTAGAAITDDGGNLLDVAPVLDPGGLKFNGGPTQTVALESGSPAIDVVPVAHCTDLALPPNPLIIDQRGFPRPDIGDSNCDIGAYEVQDISFIPFSHFGGGLKIDPDAGVFYLSGGFKLGSGGTIDPTTQPVAFGVGDYAIRLPVGSFVQHSSGYVYQKRINGIFLWVFIKVTDAPGRYVLLANRIGGTLTSTTSPVPVTLTIGANSGTTQMNARFN